MESMHDRIKKHNSCMIIYSVTSRRSFDEIDTWIKRTMISKELEKLSDFPVVLVGNQIDLREEREVSNEEGKERALNYGIPFIETSAKDDINIHEAFHLLFDKFYEIHQPKFLNQPQQIQKNKNYCILM